MFFLRWIAIAVGSIWTLGNIPTSDNDDGLGTIIIPGPGDPEYDDGNIEPSFQGLTRERWDDALVGLVLVGLVLFSKPWK